MRTTETETTNSSSEQDIKETKKGENRFGLSSSLLSG